MCCFSTSVYCCKREFRYRFSPETFGYTHTCVYMYVCVCVTILVQFVSVGPMILISKVWSFILNLILERTQSYSNKTK
jgi:hypothetical protein